MALSTEQAPTGQLKRPHFHWVWKPAGQPNASWKWQLFGYYWRETPRRLNLVFSFRGLLLWTASLSFAAYFIGAAVIVGIWSRNPYNQVGYLDVVLPTRWAELRALRGKGLIAEGVAEIKAKRYAIGIMRLTQGVARAPEDFTGRLELARIYVALGQLHRAQEYLTKGIEFGTPPRIYRDTLFRLARYMENYSSILEISDTLSRNAPADMQRELVQWRAIALEKLGRLDDLERLRVSIAGNGVSIPLELSWARAQVASGKPKQALDLVRNDPERFGLPEERFELEVELALAAGEYARALAAVQSWKKLNITGARPRIREIVVLIHLGRNNEAQTCLANFFDRFSADAAAEAELFRGLLEGNQTIWLQRAFAEAASLGRVSIPARVVYIQGLIETGETSEARKILASVVAEIKAAKIDDGGWSLGTTRLLDAIEVPSPSTEALVIEFFGTRKLAPDAFRFGCRALNQAGSPLARDLAVIAHNRFPSMRLPVIDVPERAARPQEAPPPSPQAAVSGTQPQKPTDSERLVREFPTDAHVRAELGRVDQLIEENRLPEAFERLQRLEKANSESNRDDLLLRRLTLHGERGELSQLYSSAKLLMLRQRVDQATLRRLAERWNNDRQRDACLALLHLVQERYPNAKWASEMQKQVERGLLIAPAGNVLENR